MTHPGNIQTIDAAQFGEPRTGCAYLVRGEKTALIDAGTAAGAPRLLAALSGLHLDYVFLTHLHLDHAGGAGHIARAHPEAIFVVHAKGVRHLIDPERLAAGVRASSPALAPQYGNPLAIDSRRVVACADQERYTLGHDVALTAIETPGHAPHHVCYFESGSRVLFVGDAVGHHAVPVDLPLTVPPRFDPEASRASLARLSRLQPKLLAYAHYGLAGDAPTLLESYPRRVEEWLARVDALRKDLEPEAVADAVLGDPRYGTLSQIGKEVARLCVRGALLTLEPKPPTSRNS
jgi:glyoxylase-like metal-dependent hydrolase (beta-lactamase superfamily II)